MKNKKTDIAKIFDEHAKSYADQYFNVEYYGDALEAFYANTKANGQFLDLACGPGNLTSHLLRRFPKAKVLGTDIANEMLEIAAKENPKATFKNLACADLVSLNQKFDGILCGFVLPYLNKDEVSKLILDCYNRLKKDGAFYLSGNLGSYSDSELQGASTGKGPKLYSFYYSKEFVEKKLENTGFKILFSESEKRNYDGFEALEINLVVKK